jgi:penicillin-binding protein 2
MHLKLGFASKTGIDIGEEAAGFIPGEDYYVKMYGEKWPRSIMASLGIGQGEVSVTPLQLSKVCSSNCKQWELVSATYC